MISLAAGTGHAAGLNRRGLLAAGLAATMVLTGCTGTDPDEVGDGSEVSTVTLAGYYDQAVTWSTCPDRSLAECASVVVPIDYGAPDAGSLTLRLLRATPADDSDVQTPRPQLLVSLGDVPTVSVRSEIINPVPGLAAVRFPFVSSELRAAYEVIGLDPRGIGLSDSFACPDDPLLSGDLDATPDTAAERKALRTSVAAHVAECVDNAGSLARTVGTAEIAADLGIVRSALGGENPAYLGIFAGARMGLHHAQDYGTDLGPVALDSLGPDPALGPQTWLAQRARAMESALDQALAYCSTWTTCPLGRTPERSRQRLLAFLEGLDDRPVDMPGTAGHLTRERAVWGMDRLLTYGVDGYGALVRVLALAYDNTPVLLNALVDAGNPVVGSAAQRARLCTDAARGGTEQDADPPETVAPQPDNVFAETFHWAARVMCRGWPRPVAEPDPTVSPVATDSDAQVTIGMIDIPSDPTTPDPRTLVEARQDSQVSVLRYEGADATAYVWSRCVRVAVTALLLDGEPLPNRCPDRTRSASLSTGAELGRSG